MNQEHNSKYTVPILKSDEEIFSSTNTKTDSSTALVNELRQILQLNQTLKETLLESLTIAKDTAQKDLQKPLYEALTWPTNLEDYLTFLKQFCRWIPRQSAGPWVTRKDNYNQSQEVYDRLCHFHYIIGHKSEKTQSDKLVKDYSDFSEWLVKYTQCWGQFLDTPESFTEETFKTFLSDLSSDYHVKDSMVYDHQAKKYVPNDPSGWVTFNQFFARTLNTGLRPIHEAFDNREISSPADCTYKDKYKINNDSTVDGICTVKITHKYASIHDLLDNSQYKDEFAGGKFVHYFLGPNDYHRFHSPVAGEILECRNVHGKVMLDVNIDQEKGCFDAPDDAEGGYEFAQARGILIIDTAVSGCQNVGKVAILPIGMCQVSSVIMKGVVGKNIAKGDEFGYFQFGGSDIIMLFQKDTNPIFFEEEKHYLYGEKIGTLTGLSKSTASKTPLKV